MIWWGLLALAVIVVGGTLPTPETRRRAEWMRSVRDSSEKERKL